MIDYSIVGSKKIIVNLMKIGVERTDNQLEEVADSLFDATNNDFEKTKRIF